MRRFRFVDSTFNQRLRILLELSQIVFLAKFPARVHWFSLYGHDVFKRHSTQTLLTYVYRQGWPTESYTFCNCRLIKNAFYSKVRTLAYSMVEARGNFIPGSCRPCSLDYNAFQRVRGMNLTRKKNILAVLSTATSKDSQNCLKSPNLESTTSFSSFNLMTTFVFTNTLSF